MDLEDLQNDARRFSGLFAGQFSPEEYAPHIKAGVLRKVWSGTAGFMGLAKLEVVYPNDFGDD